MYLDLDLFRFILEKIPDSVVSFTYFCSRFCFYFCKLLSVYPGFWFIYLGFCVNLGSLRCLLLNWP